MSTNICTLVLMLITITSLKTTNAQISPQSPCVASKGDCKFNGQCCNDGQTNGVCIQSFISASIYDCEPTTCVQPADCTLGKCCVLDTDRGAGIVYGMCQNNEGVPACGCPYDCSRYGFRDTCCNFTPGNSGTCQFNSATLLSCTAV